MSNVFLSIVNGNSWLNINKKGKTTVQRKSLKHRHAHRILALDVSDVWKRFVLKVLHYLKILNYFIGALVMLVSLTTYQNNTLTNVLNYLDSLEML